MTQHQRIIHLLASRGSEGATNAELNKIGQRFGGRLGELRKVGFVFDKERVKGSLWRYRLLTPKNEINWETMRPKEVVQGTLTL